tara:strand:+ start:943 stop:1290 length:348 start_codon:yes stop_codon:yes gene_type:complete
MIDDNLEARIISHTKSKTDEIDSLVLAHDVIKIFASEAYWFSDDPHENEIGRLLNEANEKINDKINELLFAGQDSDFIRTDDNFTGTDKKARAILCRIFTRMKFKEGFDELGLPL